MKVYIVGGNSAYTKMFIDRGWQGVCHPIDADLIQFTGGEDVTPEIYGEKNTHSHNDFNRDLKEAGYFALAQRMGKPMAGICRGGQFLNVMCGGKMIQHVEGHATGKNHTIEECVPRWSDKDNSMYHHTVNVTSTHHQMMIANLNDDNCEVIAIGHIRPNADYDTEIVFYYDQKVLCFQPHPEFGKGECQDYYFELLDRCLGLKV